MEQQEEQTTEQPEEQTAEQPEEQMAEETEERPEVRHHHRIPHHLNTAEPTVGVCHDDRGGSKTWSSRSQSKSMSKRNSKVMPVTIMIRCE